jgi:glycine betaine/choline ABC-type transport system substrate-binding protein
LVSAGIAAVIAVSPALGACSAVDTIPGSTASEGTIVVGSTDGLPMEMVAEIYKQALDRYGQDAERGKPVDDVTLALAELDAGRLTVVPEVSSELLEYLNPSATAQTDPEILFDELSQSMPNGLSVGDYALAADRDSASEDESARNIVPIYRTGALADDALKALNKVAGELTTADLLELCNKERGGASRSGIVSNWLDQHGF